MPLLNEKDEPFGPANPHPLYGKDKNIANEFGHTHYPKMVKIADGSMVRVENEAELEELKLFIEPEKVAPEKSTKKAGWGK